MGDSRPSRLEGAHRLLNPILYDPTLLNLATSIFILSVIKRTANLALQGGEEVSSIQTSSLLTAFCGIITTEMPIIL